MSNKIYQDGRYIGDIQEDYTAESLGVDISDEDIDPVELALEIFNKKDSDKSEP